MKWYPISSSEERCLKAYKGVQTRKDRYGADIYLKLGKMGIKNGARIRETLKKRYASGKLTVTPKQLDATL